MTTIQQQPLPPPPYEDINAWVRYYRNVWGINTSPAPTQDKGKDEKDRQYSWIPWQPYQFKPISDETQESYIRNGEYTKRKGLGILPGKVWFGPNEGKWLVAADADNQVGIEIICEMFDCTSLEELAAKGVVIEQHPEDASDKAHFYFYSDTPFHNLPGIKTRKGGDKNYDALVKENKFPAVEIKCQDGGCQFGCPSLHSGGQIYRHVAGSISVPTLCLTEAEAANVISKLENTLNFYGDSYLEYKGSDGKSVCITIEELWKPDYRVTAGNNRHLDCRRTGASLLIKSLMANKDQALSTVMQWNNDHCVPPLSFDEVKFGFDRYSVLFAEDKIIERREQQRRLEEERKLTEEEKEVVTKTTTTITVQRPNSPLLKGYNDDYFEYLIQYASKTVKQEETLLRQIFYTFLSSYAQQLANNLSLRAPSSEGKTYPIIRALNASGAPDNEIITVNHITPTALIYQSGGLLVDKDGKPIRDQVKQLKKDIGRARNRKDWDTLEEKKEQLEKLLEGSAYVLELNGKCFLLLEPPKEGLWDLLKAILSHDKPETRHMMTDKGSQGMATKNVILRGFPAFIFCSAKDESHWEVWEEVQTRFMFTSPNMIPQKYYEGNKLLGKKFGLPNFSKSKIMALGSPEEFRLANQCYSWLKYQIKSYYATPEESAPVWIPYQDQLTELLPYMRGSDNRVASRLLQLLTVITLCRAHLRYTLIDKETGQRCVIANLEDLQEALHITQNVSGLPPHKLRFYVNTILRLCKQREKELQEKGLPIGKIALTSTEITDFYNGSLPIGAKKYTADSITKVFLDELHNHNYLEKEQDQNTNRQRYYYYPIVDIGEEVVSALETQIMMSSSSSSLGRLGKKLHFMRLMLPKNHVGFPKDWLKLQFLQDFDCRVEEPNLKVCGKDGKEVSLKTFIDSYETPELNLLHFYKRPQDGLDNGKSVEITKTSSSNGDTIVKIITESVQNSETVSSHLNFDQLDKNNGDGGGNGKGGICSPSETEAIAVSEPTVTINITAGIAAAIATLSHYKPSQPALSRTILLVEQYEKERQEQAKVNNEDKTLRLLNEQLRAIPPELYKLYEASVSVDPEWVDERDKDGGGIRRIYAMSFVDWKGREMVFHIDDYKHLEGFLFEQTRAMLNDIFDYWFSNGYRMSFGFNSLGDGSDREVIFENAQHYNTTIQPVEEQAVGSGKNRRVYYKFKERELRHTHIDWFRIFKNKAVWTYVFEQKYRSFGLDVISRALFDVGKYREADGLQATKEMSIDEQKMYVLQDSRLLSLLTTAEDGNLFGAMQYIADLLELPLPKVCHSQVSQYWTTIYEKMGHKPPPLVEKINPETGETETIAEHYYYRTRTVIPTRDKNKGIPRIKVISYAGGRVLEPTPGFYRDVIGLDQESQYPTLGILHNLGFEVMCCPHADCKNDPECQIKDTGDPEIDSAGYYVCKEIGDSAYKQRLMVFRKARLEAKEKGERVKDLALKIIINGAYGVYGYKKFPFADTRVAEVTTAYARKMHRAMEELARADRYKFNVIGGDTDSIFITYPMNSPGIIKQFCDEFKERYQITIKPSKKYWSKMLITKKKHYIFWEWGNENNPTIKGMEAAKNNMPKLTNIIFDQFVKNIGADRDFIPDLRRAWLEEYPYCKNHRPDLLQVEVRVGKDPETYVGDKLIKRLAIHQHKGKDDTIRYYEIGKENEKKYGGLDAYLNSEHISDEIYKQKFFISPFEDILEQLGYDVKEVFG